MPFTFHLDHRVAFVLLCAMVLTAAAPLAWAWARVLPEDKPPLAPIERDPERRGRFYLHEAPAPKRELFPVVLLVLVTLSYASQFPGLPRDFSLGSLPLSISRTAGDWLELTVIGVLVLTPGFAAAYSLVRTHFLRTPLLIGGVLVLCLWLFAPPLCAALIAN